MRLHRPLFVSRTTLKGLTVSVFVRESSLIVCLFRYIKVSNTSLALLYYVAMLGLLCYVGIYQIWYKGGYQKIIPFEGAVDVKVKGAGYLGDFDTCANGVDWPSCGPFDTYDTSVPPQQEGAVFVATSFYTTPKQTRGLCNTKFSCTADSECSKGLNGTGTGAKYE